VLTHERRVNPIQVTESDYKCGVLKDNISCLSRVWWSLCGNLTWPPLWTH